MNNNDGMAIASMILGILSIVFCCCYGWISIPLAIIGIILGAVCLSKNTSGRGMAIAGIVTSIIALALLLVAIFIIGSVASFY